MVDKFIIKSVPNDRDKFTSRLRPNLASHTPMVNKIMAKVGAENISLENKNEGIKRTRDNIIPSKHNKVSKKCDRWISKAIKVNK